MGLSHMSQLQASAAQAVADLANSSASREKREQDIIRQGGTAALETYAAQQKRLKGERDPSEELRNQLQGGNHDGLPAA
jgi:hypothetical protein